MSLKFLLFLPPLLGLLFSSGAHANREEIISGGLPYLVVIEDTLNNSSSRTPGIYVRNTSGGWDPLALGRVSILDKMGSYIVPLEQSAHTQLANSFAFIDGQLNIFNINGFKSVLDNMHGEGHLSVWDPSAGREVKIPAISPTSTPSYFQKMINLDSGKNIQLIIISLDSPNPNGSGITLAIPLDALGKNPEDITLHSKPIVLEWDYLKSTDLRRRFVSRTKSRYGPSYYGYISKSLLEDFSRPAQPDEALPLTRWRQNLIQKLDELSNDDFQLLPSNPRLDVLTGDVRIEELPVASIGPSVHDKRNFLFVFDPSGKKSGLYETQNYTLSLEEFRTTKPMFYGEPACHPDCSLKDFPSTVSINKTKFDFFEGRNGSLYLLATMQDERSEILTFRPPSASKEVENVSYYLNPKDLSLFVSWLYKDKSGGTEIYRLKIIGNNVRVTNHVGLNSTYYDAVNLELRNIEKAPGLLFFDHSTAYVSNKSEYTALYKPTKLHFDVKASLDQQQPVSIHIQPLSEDYLLPNIIFQEHEGNNGTFSNKTGVYLMSPNPHLVTPTSLIRTTESWGDFKRKIIIKGKETDVGFFFTDSSHKNGNDGSFQVYMGVSSSDELSFKEIADFSVPFSDLEYFHFINLEGALNYLDGPHFVVLCFYKIKDKGLFAGTVELYQGEKERRFKFEKLTTLNDVARIAGRNSQITIDELENNLRFDQKGNVYWNMTPELQDTDVNLKIKNFITHETINPHQRNLILTKTRGGESRFIGGNWRAFTKRTEPFDQRRTAEIKTDVFQQYRQLLEDLANPSKPPRRVILIVPEDIKNYALNYPLSLLEQNTSHLTHWSPKQDQLKLFDMNPGRMNQEDVIENLTALRRYSENKEIRPFLLGRLKDLKAHRRPSPSALSTTNFTISDPHINAKIGSENESSEAQEKIIPHLFYLLATEGQHIPLSEFANNSDKSPHFSTLLIGTQEELNALFEPNDIENNVNLKEAFEPEHIAELSNDLKIEFVKEFLARKEIQDLHYKIDTASFTPKSAANEDEARLIVAQHFVNRSNYYAKENEKTDFEGFLIAVNVLTSELQLNSQIRARRIIDLGVVDSFFARIYPVTPRLDMLPPDHPKKKIMDKNAVWLWKKSGYSGPVAIMQGVINDIASQFNPSNTKNMSSAFIIEGPSRSGKTRLIDSLFKDFLKVKEYDPRLSPEENDGAWYFKINCASIFSKNDPSNPADQGRAMTIEQLIAHIETFLASANGPEGFLFFDDLHAAPNDVRRILMQMIRNFQEKSTFDIHRNGTVERISNRNLTIGVLLNPPSSKEMIAKIPNGNTMPPLWTSILASLSTPDQIYEESWIKRFRSVYQLEFHSKEAKSPQLRADLAGASKNTYMNSQTLNFVSQEVINLLADTFPKADATTFTTPSVANLIQMNSTQGKLLIAVPKITAHTLPMGAKSIETVTSEQIEKFIREKTEIVSIEKTIRGRLEFSRYLIDSTRKLLFQVFFKALNEDMRFVGHIDAQQFYGAPVARAVYDHIQTIPSLPVTELHLDPYKMNAASPELQKQFRDLLKIISIDQQRQMNFTPPKVGFYPAQDIYEEFTTGKSAQYLTRTRQHVLKDTGDKLLPTLQKFIQETFRVNNLSSPPSTEEWINRIKPEEVNLVEVVGKPMMDELAKYIIAIHGADILETQKERSDSSPPMNKYEAIRLFALILDQTLGRLPWEELTNFMIKNLMRTTQDLLVGHNINLQYILFESKSSPLFNIDASLVTGYGAVTPFFEEFGNPDPSRLHKEFSSRCFQLLSIESVGNLK